MRHRRSRVAGLVAVPVALAVLAGCSAGPEEPSDDGPYTIRVVASNEPATMNAIYSATSDAKSWGAIYDALIGDDPATNEPNDNGLLYEWTQPDPNTWIFKVREGVTFHDGTPFDAEAAAFTILTEKTDPKANLGMFYKTIDTAGADGDDLKVTTVSPTPFLPKLLASTMAISPTAWKADDNGATFQDNPVGTGPFVFDSYSKGGTLRAVANEDYWRGAPPASAIEVSWNADAQTRASMVQAGQAELALDLTPQALAVLKDDDSVSLVTAPIDARYFIMLNEKEDGPMADPEIRKAMAMAIDKDAIVSSLFKDGGAQAYDSIVGDLFSETPTYDDQIEYDPEAAAAIVAAKGNPEITFTYATGRSPNDAQMGTAIVGMLEAVGFTVTNDPVDFPTFASRRNEQSIQAGALQIIYTYRDADEEFRAWVNSTSVAKTCIPDWYDEQTDAALAAPDEESRQKIYEQMEDRLLNQDVCYIPIVKYEGIWAMTPKLQGFKPARIATPDYFRLSLD